MNRESGIIDEVVSLEGNNLVILYYLSASEISPMVGVAIKEGY